MEDFQGNCHKLPNARAKLGKKITPFSPISVWSPAGRILRSAARAHASKTVSYFSALYSLPNKMFSRTWWHEDEDGKAWSNLPSYSESRPAEQHMKCFPLPCLSPQPGKWYLVNMLLVEILPHFKNILKFMANSKIKTTWYTCIHFQSKGSTEHKLFENIALLVYVQDKIGHL